MTAVKGYTSYTVETLPNKLLQVQLEKLGLHVESPTVHEECMCGSGMASGCTYTTEQLDELRKLHRYYII